MSQSINAYVSAHKDDIQQDFYLFLEIYLGSQSAIDSDTVLLCMRDAVTTIKHGAIDHDYYPYPFLVGNMSDGDNIGTFNVTFANVSGKQTSAVDNVFFPMSYLHVTQAAIDGKGFKEKRVRVFKVMINDTTNPTYLSYDDSAFEIKDMIISQVLAITKQAFVVKCVQDILIRKKLIPIRNYTSRCPWRFKVVDDRWWLWGGAECPYAGGNTVCNKLYNDTNGCAFATAAEKDAHFGGIDVV